MPRSDQRYGVLGRFRRFLPPSHRLFALFDDRSAAVAALATAEAMGVVDGSQTWFFDGELGAGHLDPRSLLEGGAVTVVRFAIWVFSNNVEYLTTLAKAVRQGRTVVAVRVRGQTDADRAARWLWFGGGSTFAYTTHGNFVPVVL
jgi:hypothetical protein